MLYVESRKSFKVRREKNYLFTELKKHLANLFLCRVLKKKHLVNLFHCQVPLTDTRQTPNGWHTN